MLSVMLTSASSGASGGRTTRGASVSDTAAQLDGSSNYMYPFSVAKSRRTEQAYCRRH